MDTRLKDRGGHGAPREIAVEAEGSGTPLGFVTIDSTINGRARGGLRLMLDVSQSEVAKLARAMTLKYGFLGLPQGGAKAGALGNPEGGPEERAAALQRFASAIRPLLQRRQYVPDADMGTSSAEIRSMLQGVGVPASRREYRGTRSGDYTAGTVFEAARAAAAVKSIKLPGCKVAIEGFGKVGQPLAEMFVRAGARVVAISTTCGGLYDPNGLDIAGLRAMTQSMGSSGVEQYDTSKRIGNSLLKEIPADIFCPCARHDSVQESDVARMSAAVLSCGANSPIAPQAERLLWQRGIVCVPDFVANCGGVLGGTMEFCGWRPDEVLAFCGLRFRPAVERLIQAALKTGRTLRATAEEVALTRFHEVKREAERLSVAGCCFNAGLALYRAGWLPAQVMRPLSKGYFLSRVP